MNSPYKTEPECPEAIDTVASRLSVTVGLDKGRIAFLLIAAIFLVLVGYSTIYRAAWNDIERTDFTVYRAAGEAIINAVDIYTAHNSRGWAYVYPPPFAILMIPFAWMPVDWGAGIWYLLSLGMLVRASTMSVSLARDLVPNMTGDTWHLYELPAFLLLPYLLSGLARCQASEWMIWLIVAAIYCGQRNRHFLGGSALAAAALIKAFPLALLGYYIWARRWRFVLGFIVTLLVAGLAFPACIFGWHKTLLYWQEWFHLVAGPSLQADAARKANPLYEQLLDSLKPRNQSLQAILLTLRIAPGLVTPLWALISSGLFAAILIVRRYAHSSSDILPLGAASAWLLVIPPISESHYFGLLILPVTVLTVLASASPIGKVRRLTGACLWGFAVLSACWPLMKSLQLYRMLGWFTLSMTLMLLFLTAWLQPKAPTPSQPGVMQ